MRVTIPHAGKWSGFLLSTFRYFSWLLFQQADRQRVGRARRRSSLPLPTFAGKSSSITATAARAGPLSLPVSNRNTHTHEGGIVTCSWPHKLRAAPRMKTFSNVLCPWKRCACKPVFFLLTSLPCTKKPSPAPVPALRVLDPTRICVGDFWYDPHSMCVG